MDDPDWRRFHRLVMLAFGATLVLATLTSIDFYQADEYFQTIELASFKLGTTPVSALPWEFEARIRPWLLPSIYFGIAKAFGALGVTDPFSLARLFRAFSALASFGSIWLLSRAAEVWCPRVDQRRAVLLIACFAFYVPYLAVRTSSEATSAAALTAAVALLARPSRARHWLAGALLGLAFDLRFQTAIASAGVVAWVALRGERRVRGAIELVAAALPTVALGALVDVWGYGALTFTPLNYFRVNLLRGAAARFSQDPPWAYFWLPHQHPFAPLSVAIMAFALLGLWLTRRHVATWAIVPFLLLHMAIAHKEERFLFPIVPLASFHAAVGASHFAKVWAMRRGIPAKVLYAINVAVMLGLVTLPKTFIVVVQKYLHDNPEPVTLATNDPYQIYGISMWFYRTEDVKVMTAADARARIEARTGEVRVVCAEREGPCEARAQLDEHGVLQLVCIDQDQLGCAPFADGRVVHRSLPTWIGAFDVGGWVEKTKKWEVIAYPAR